MDLSEGKRSRSLTALTTKPKTSKNSSSALVPTRLKANFPELSRRLPEVQKFELFQLPSLEDQLVSIIEEEMQAFEKENLTLRRHLETLRKERNYLVVKTELLLNMVTESKLQIESLEKELRRLKIREQKR